MTIEITIEEMLNSEIITESIKRDDELLAADGWTYEEAVSFGKSMKK